MPEIDDLSPDPPADPPPAISRGTVLVGLAIVATIVVAAATVYWIQRPGPAPEPLPAVRIPESSVTLDSTATLPESDYFATFVGNSSAVEGIRMTLTSSPSTALDFCIDTNSGIALSYDQCISAPRESLSWAALPHLTTCLPVPPGGYDGLSASVVVPSSVTSVVVTLQLQVNDTGCSHPDGDDVDPSTATLTPVSTVKSASIEIPLGNLPAQRSDLELWLNTSSVPISVSAPGLDSTPPSTSAFVILDYAGSTSYGFTVGYASAVPDTLTIEGVAYG